MKRCTQCNKVKSLNSFNKRKNGFQYKCKTCISLYCKERYSRKKEYILNQNSSYRKTKTGKAKMKTLIKSWKIKNPLKNKAHIAVMNAIKTGILKKEPCNVCGTKDNLNAHHESYLKKDWLNVLWLCRKHHLELHKNK